MNIGMLRERFVEVVSGVGIVRNGYIITQYGASPVWCMRV